MLLISNKLPLINNTIIVWEEQRQKHMINCMSSKDWSKSLRKMAKSLWLSSGRISVMRSLQRSHFRILRICKPVEMICKNLRKSSSKESIQTSSTLRKKQASITKTTSHPSSPCQTRSKIKRTLQAT